MGCEGLTLEPAERFFAKVEFTDTCWLWTGSTKGVTGYGAFWLDGKRILAHRWAYEFCVGSIPDELTIDHLCRVRLCVNVAHLEPVTRGVNVMRGEGVTARNARKTHCPQGHPYEGTNLYVSSQGKRHCLTCINASHRVWLQKKRGSVV